MKHTTLITILLILSPTLSAQEREDVTNFWAVKWVSSSITTPLFPHLRFGVEKRWEKYSINAQAGMSIPKEYKIDKTISGRSAGYAYRLELRKYTRYFPSTLQSQMFWGLEAFYFHSHDKRSAEFTADTSIVKSYHIDEFTYIKDVAGLVAKWGVQFYVGKHFMFEASTGLGPKWRNLTEQHKDANSIRQKPNQSWDWEFRTDDNNVVLAFPMLFAVGYRF